MGCRAAMAGEVRVSTLMAYGSISLPIGTIGLPVAIYLAPVYSGQLGIGLGIIGWAMIATRLMDFVTDPIIGVLSDRWRPKIGRRRVWLIIGTLVMMSGVYLLFRPHDTVNIAYFLVALSLVYFGYTTLLLPYKAWGAELSEDYHVRTRISSMAQFFNIAGLIASTLIPAYILSRQGATGTDVLAGLSLFILIGLPLSALIVFFCVPEPAAPVHKTPFRFAHAAKLLLHNGPFALLTCVIFIATIGETFRQTITVFFARDVVGVQNIGAVYFYYFAAGLIMVPGWTWLAARIQKHRALILALSVVALTNVSMFFISEGDIGVFIAIFVIKGMCFGGVLLLPAAMIADAVDIDTATSLDRQQGLFFAVEAMVQKLGFALGAGLPLIILGAFGFNSDGETRSEQLTLLSGLYSFLPAILVIIAAWLLRTYSLTEAHHSTLRAHIAAQMTASESSPSQST